LWGQGAQVAYQKISMQQQISPVSFVCLYPALSGFEEHRP
jgi:hypothetical protein